MKEKVTSSHLDGVRQISWSVLKSSETLILLIWNSKTKDYVPKDAIRDYFQIIEKGVTESKVEETM